MRFKTENERMQHPEAKLIPPAIWYNHFFNELSDFNLELMQIPKDNLFDSLRSASGMADVFKLEALLCCAYRSPSLSLNDHDLVDLMKIFNIPSNQQLVFAAIIGRLGIVNILAVSPTLMREMITFNNFVAFRYAGGYGHVEVMNRIIDLASNLNPIISLNDMIKADNFEAFRQAAEHGHIEVMDRLIELASTFVPPIIKEMISAQDFSAFRQASCNGHLDVMNRLIELASKLEPTISVADMIKAGNFEAFRFAANGHLDVMNRLIEFASRLVPPIPVADMIKANNFAAFGDAAAGGHLNVMNHLIELASNLDFKIPVAEMIMANNFKAFRNAVENGHLDMMNHLIELASTIDPPTIVQNMIRAVNSIRGVALRGHLGVLNRLLDFAPDFVWNIIKSENFAVFYIATMRGHLDITKRFIELALSLEPSIFEYMIKSRGDKAFDLAARSNDYNFANKLLTLPSVFAYAEMHEEEFEEYVKPFIEKKLATLKLRKQENHPSVVVTQQEAKICFYILRNLIRQSPIEPSPGVLANIEFLISIPAVKSLLHRPISAHGFHNELLREAIRLGNRGMVDLLMDIPEVMAQAERDDFYTNEALGRIDLRTVAQNRESSMSALSPQEQMMLSRVEKKYGPSIAEIGIEKAFSHVYQEIIARYNDRPALLTLANGETIKLPLDYKDFGQIADKFSVTDKKNALKAYYQHPTHSVFRYLSKPNPWMAANTFYVRVNDETGEQWSTFEGYKDMITLLWRAAVDESELATDGYTVATRVDELINEIALIGRAHNWDNTRVISDKNGQPILDDKGNPIREEYDDLEGDKPSCYSGVKRRLFQALKGCPLFQDVQTVINFNLHEKLRAHMMKQFKNTNTPILEAVLINYTKLAQSENIETLSALTSKWDVPAETILQWKQEIQQHYDEIFGRDEVMDCIEREFQNFFKQSSSLGSQFLALAARSQLTQLCEQELKERADTLANKIKTEPNLINFLNRTDEVTGETRLLNAIHLGLLGEIGERLGSEKFTQLLSPDEATRQAYAGVLAAYSDKDKLDKWLANFNEPLKTVFTDEINEIAFKAAEFLPSPVEKFKIFLNNLDTKNSEIRKLFRKVVGSTSLDTTKLEGILKEWLLEYPLNKAATQICDKALELKLDLKITTAIAATTQTISSSSSNEMKHKTTELPKFTFENLQNDPTGAFLEQFEQQELEAKQPKISQNRHSFHALPPHADNETRQHEPKPRNNN